MKTIKELAIISGKGGTGKTSLAASFASLSKSKILADCDVDAANLYLVLEPRVRHQENFIGGRKADINLQNCNACGLCIDLCRFGAVIKDGPPEQPDGPVFHIDPLTCEGCGVCVRFCPRETIEFKEIICGKWFISDTRHGPMVHARLGTAEENSGKLAALIRQKARDLALKKGLGLVIIDGPPGIGCPAIASITGSDFVLAVTEPTLSGLHDLIRVAQLTSHFRIKTAVCLNKYDLNPKMSSKIESWAVKTGIKVIGRITYDKAMTMAQLSGNSVVEYTDGKIAREVRGLWEEVAVEMDLNEREPLAATDSSGPGYPAEKSRNNQT